ncbi:hypothetical protein Egran_02131 [Elaphomyces granulatus]|uniref:MoaB/Mog domain-containing protein n=1 Tax=Elaphomyces granulatus TaxID=519963 RepID=A0A232M1Z8_9EURO|nr:hypothetical protein Egran_02131 [Elaphomyces granulatus]
MQYELIDEMRNFQTVDTNSAYFARWCFSLGILLKRVEVITDEEDDIIESVKRLSANYDFVVTSGGIGSTHDDITYSSIAKAFGLKRKLDRASLERMKKHDSSKADFDWDTPSPVLTAMMRMVELPFDEALPAEQQILSVSDTTWVPTSVVNGNIYILPGIPSLFEGLLECLKPVLLPRLADPAGKGLHRILISTPLKESEVAAYLTDLAARASLHGVKVGSYPRWGKKRNTVTLVGTDREYIESLVPEVEKHVDGITVSREDEADPPSENEGAA